MITARVRSARDLHEIELATKGVAHAITIPPRPTGFGSSANGGEVLCLALATCWCNDVYREAAKRGIAVQGVEVEASAQFDAEGAPGKRFTYRVKVHAAAAQADIDALIRHTDLVAEVHNTLRLGLPVILESFESISTRA